MPYGGAFLAWQTGTATSTARNATVTQLSMVVRRCGFESDPTDTWNLICLCPTHHRNQLGITGNADLAPGSRGAVVFTDAWGDVSSPARHPPRRAAHH